VLTFDSSKLGGTHGEWSGLLWSGYHAADLEAKHRYHFEKGAFLGWGME